jgi:hypothetical protein
MMLITRAYGLKSFQVFGAPELNTTRFNIFGQAAGRVLHCASAGDAEDASAGRFRLEAHQDTRDYKGLQPNRNKGRSEGSPQTGGLRSRYGAWTNAGYDGAAGGFSINTTTFSGSIRQLWIKAASRASTSLT